MKTRYPRLQATVLSICSLFATTGLAAQTTDDEIIDLSPFVVTQEDDGSYLAKNAISATKFDVPLRDIPLSVQVMTESFLDDTFSLDLESSMEYAAAVNVSQSNAGTRESGMFSVRGFRAANVKRNGIAAYYAQDLTNVARVEVIKGPSSLLYGEAQPGGVINYVTKKPLQEFRNAVEFSVGSDGFVRGSFESTGPLLETKDGDPRLLYRLDASYQEQDGWTRAYWTEKSFFSPVLEYRFWKGARLTVQYEYMDSRRVTIHGFPFGSSLLRELWTEAPEDSSLKRFGAYLSGGARGTILLRKENWGVYINDLGEFEDHPLVFKDSIGRGVVILDEIAPLPYDFVGEHQNDINRVIRDLVSVDFQTPLPWDQWHLRLNSVNDTSDFFIMESRPHRIMPHSGDALRYGPAQFSSTDFNRDSWHSQVNVSGKWSLLGLENQTVLGAELREDEQRARLYGVAADPRLISGGEHFVSITGASAPYIPDGRLVVLEELAFERPQGEPSWYENFNYSTEAYFFSNLTSVWNDRIKVLAGIRRDIAYQEELTPDEQLLLRSPTHTQDSPQYGIIFEVNNALSLYASHSESFVPDNDTLRRFDPDGEGTLPDGTPGAYFFVPREPVEGLGDEIGFKIDLMDSRISGTAAYFEIENRGIVTLRETPYLLRNGNPVREQYQDGSSFSEGIDLDINLALSRGLQIVLGYAYIDSLTTISSQDGEAVSFGDSVGVPDHQATLWTKYTFLDGRLDGLSLGVGAIYTGERRLYEPSANALSTGFEDVIIYGDPYWKIDLSLAYKGRFGDHSYNLALNIKNLFDEQAFLSSGLPITPRQAFLTFRYDF